jgi:hypothetical protein
MSIQSKQWAAHVNCGVNLSQVIQNVAGERLTQLFIAVQMPISRNIMSQNNVFLVVLLEQGVLIRLHNPFRHVSPGPEPY